MERQTLPASGLPAIHPVIRMPGTEGIWTFVFIDMLIFLLIFFTFMSERLGHVELFAASQWHLSEWFGLANTLVLLTSSWMVVEAVRAARWNECALVSSRLTAAWLLGAVFAISKLAEYRLELGFGITPVTNPFFSFYFFITGVHFLHVIAGLILIHRYRRIAKAVGVSRSYLTALENVGLFWHYVDVLWIFIFPMLYLVGRSS